MERIIHYCWFGGKPLPKLAVECIESWKKFLPDYKIIEWNESNTDLEECAFISGAYKEKKWAYVADYARTKALVEFGGIYFDTDMEVTKDITNIIESGDTILGIEDSGYVAAGFWLEKNKGSELSKCLLEYYKTVKKFDKDNLSDYTIPILLTKKLIEHDLKFGYNEIQYLDNNITIFPREYFYPYSYNHEDKVFTDNTCMIHYYDASWISGKEKFVLALIRKVGLKNTWRLISIFSILKTIMIKIAKVILFPIVLYRNYKKKHISITGKYLDRVSNTVKIIDETKGDYLVFYNSEWFGVTSATKELFENLVDCGELYRKKDIKTIVTAILESNAKQVIFSSFARGWEDLVKELKNISPDIKVKTYWHGNHSQILDTYGWQRNMEIIELHKKGYVDVMGTCKQSLLEFYKHQKYNAHFISNKVDIDFEINPKVKNTKDKVIIGLYAAKCNDWRKNMYAQMGAVNLIENAVLDMVPLNKEAEEFAEQIGLEITGLNKSIPREELIKRMANNDVNLYVTLSECSPMLPLESFEAKVPCIVGNNHHYFIKSDLEEKIVVFNEDNVEEIVEKINYCIDRKEEVLNSYEVFAKKNRIASKNQVKEFLGL